MDKSPKRSPKPKKKKKAIIEINKDIISEQIIQTGKTKKNKNTNPKIIKGKPKQLI